MYFLISKMEFYHYVVLFDQFSFMIIEKMM